MAKCMGSNCLRRYWFFKDEKSTELKLYYVPESSHTTRCIKVKSNTKQENIPLDTFHDKICDIFDKVTKGETLGAWLSKNGLVEKKIAEFDVSLLQAGLPKGVDIPAIQLNCPDKGFVGHYKLL